jgi:hypothetical protein
METVLKDKRVNDYNKYKIVLNEAKSENVNIRIQI